MIPANEFLEYLGHKGITFFSGVPDSTLAGLCGCLLTHDTSKNFIAANEGSAIGLAIGHHLATGEIPCVYMQNSGIGNAVNPLLSLGAADVYTIPVLLIIGYRGEPGVHDAPQHIMQGKVTEDLLKVMGIPFSKIRVSGDVVHDECHIQWHQAIDTAINTIEKTKTSYALLVSKGAFDKATLPPNSDDSREKTFMLREQALEIIDASVNDTDIIVSTTGMTSRELWEIRSRKDHQLRDFPVVGGMGHCSQIALSISLAHRERRVFCLDGDGSVLMHMGSIALIGKEAPENFVHIVMNNGMHESVGGHPTLGRFVDFPALFSACGYKTTKRVFSPMELKEAIHFSTGPGLIEVFIRGGHRTDLGRPDKSCKEIKEAFMNHCNGTT